MSGKDENLPAETGRRAEIGEFLDKVRALAPEAPGAERGRLVFALDATASRQPTWDRACRLTGEMFEAAAGLGGLELQLVFYRGFHECKASRWLGSAEALHRAMGGVSCVGGQTQIGRVLDHAARAAKARRVSALVFIGDAMEESAAALCRQAGELKLLGVPVFIFHEGGDPAAGAAFREIARLSGGAYCGFDSASAGMLRDLLAAVAIYAAGGRRALEDHGRKQGGAIRLIAAQLGKGGGAA